MPQPPPINDAAPTQKLTVWDLPTRLFHWALVVLLVISYVTAQIDELEWHFLSGYAVMALLLFRLAWGLVGSDTARFSQFLCGPRTLWSYVCGVWPARAGHNPAGGWAVAAMLIVLCAQVGTGLFADDDIVSEGPLAQFVEHHTSRVITGLHHRNFNILLALVALHVTAIASYRMFKQRNLVWPMLRGWMLMPADVPAPRTRSLWLAGALFVAAGLVAYCVASFAT